MRIAFITSRFPYPVEKGDKLRAFQHIRWLGERHELHLFALTHQDIRDEDVAAVKEYCSSVHIYRIPRSRLLLNVLSGWVNGLPAQVAYFLDQRNKAQMQEDLIRLRPQHVFVQLIRAAEYVRALPISKTLDYMDVFSVGAAQRAASGVLFTRPLFAMESRRLRKYEKAIYGDFTNHVIISAQDRDRLPLPYQGSVAVLSNGVDLDYFVPDNTIEPEYDVVFVGNLGYMPNIEAGEFLVKKIMSRVWKTFPDTKVCLTGARPHARIRRLQSPRVKVTGWVDDVRPYYAKGKVFVAPIFSGMGQQNKILEAMAMQKPCVTTTLVDKAIGGLEEGALLTAENAEGFANALLRLLDDDVLAKHLGETARRFVAQRYSWEMQNNVLDSLLTRRSKPETIQV